MGYSESFYFSFDAPKLSKNNIQSWNNFGSIIRGPKKLCKKCKEKHAEGIRQTIISKSSTPLFTQFKRRKPCSCSKHEWKAYKMYYFTVLPNYSSTKLEYFHVIEIRLQCQSCQKMFPLSITFKSDKIKCHFGEYMKIDTWFWTSALNMKFERLMKGYFYFYDYFQGISKKSKEIKGYKIRANQRFYVRDCWYSILIEGVKPEVIDEIVPEEECECFGKKNEENGFKKSAVERSIKKKKLLAECNTDSDEKFKKLLENAKSEKIERTISEDGSECYYQMEEKNVEENVPEYENAEEVIPKKEDENESNKKQKSIKMEMKKLKMLKKSAWKNMNEMKEEKKFFLL